MLRVRSTIGPAGGSRPGQAGRPGPSPKAILALCGAIASMLAMAPPPAAAEVETHVFDAQLSLRGTCATNKLDPVPDPGCPYPAPPEGPPPFPDTPQPFSDLSGVTIDSHGYIYVSSKGGDDDGSEGHLDIFDPAGEFVLELTSEQLFDALDIDTEEAGVTLNSLKNPTVDSLGNLYLHLSRASSGQPPHFEDIARLTPSAYPPTKATAYGSPHLFDLRARSFAIDPEDDHVYVNVGEAPPAVGIAEYDSAANGNALLRSGIAKACCGGIAIGPGGDIFAANQPSSASVVSVFANDGTVLQEIDGSDTPGGKFFAAGGFMGVAVEQSNGDLYVYDAKDGAKGVVYQFRRDEGSGEYEHLSTIEHSFIPPHPTIRNPALDNGATSPNQGYLFVPSHPVGVGHLFAFEPKPEIGPPLIEAQSFSGVGTEEALLEAELDPNGAASRYRFEYVKEETYFEGIEAEGPGHGFDQAIKVPEPDASLPAGNEAVPVSASVVGLEPGTTYRFRLRAENCDPEEAERPCTTTGEGKPGEEGEDARFATYPVQTASPPCPNDQFRAGPAAHLPDCRAYELVTPPDTGGRLPRDTSGSGGGDAIDTYLPSPDGESLIFGTTGGALPGMEGSGGLWGDLYQAKRGSGGWMTESSGPSGAQMRLPAIGGSTADRYSFWNTKFGGGALEIEGKDSRYLRMPTGDFELIGQGSLGIDPQAEGKSIAPGASHVIFASGAKAPSVQLEPNAPPAGIDAIYDRTADGATHVVSLLPGEVTPAADATYLGASPDGSAVAFKVGNAASSPLYLRLGNAETLVVTEETDSTFAGISADGGRVFYIRANDPKEPATGELFAFDVASQQTTQIGSGNESTVVNISADGSHVYFVSTKVLEEGEGTEGKDNLYVWDGEAVRFIATLEHIDVTGVESVKGSGVKINGLGLWTPYINNKTEFKGPANDPSRTTPEGRFLLFESRAPLTGYETNGHSQVYRYDSATEELLCLSCHPTLAPASGPAELQFLAPPAATVTPLAPTANIAADGQTAFFESEEALVLGDVDDLRDVYEWKAQGSGDCKADDGCLYLLSGAHSTTPTFLYAATPDGSDVFFHTTDFLLGADLDGSPSIYDARVGGGFPEEAKPPCQGIACRISLGSAPNLPAAGATGGSGNLKPRPRCAKGKRRVVRRGRTRCVRKHTRKQRASKHQRRRAGR